MWICPECGRELKKRHQDHFCGRPPESIRAYIARQPEAVQPMLFQLHEQILSTARDLEPRIVRCMPTYWRGQNIIQFAACRDHVSIYPGKEAMEALRGYADRHAQEATEDFKNQWGEYVTAYDASGGTLRIPYDRSLPEMLIRGITRWCYRQYAFQGDTDYGTDEA